MSKKTVLIAFVVFVAAVISFAFRYGAFASIVVQSFTPG